MGLPLLFKSMMSIYVTLIKIKKFVSLVTVFSYSPKVFRLKATILGVSHTICFPPFSLMNLYFIIFNCLQSEVFEMFKQCSFFNVCFSFLNVTHSFSCNIFVNVRAMTSLSKESIFSFGPLFLHSVGSLASFFYPAMKGCSF